MDRSEVFGEVRLLLKGALAGAADVASLVVVDGRDVAEEAVLEGERLGADVAREALLLLVHAHHVLVQVAPLPEGALTMPALVRPVVLGGRS